MYSYPQQDIALPVMLVWITSPLLQFRILATEQQPRGITQQACKESSIQK